MEAIKLVIWDLDETFWEGTLSEGPIRYRPENHELVIELSRRGVVNSICSKNDLEAARGVLAEQGIWDYFVFPKIAWCAKGEMIAQTLEEMGLRAPNILFVDDNPQNLEEAKFYNPGLQVAAPDELANLLERPTLDGKNDAQLSRLNQYRLLQKKVGDRQQFESNNEEFLRQCQIRVEVCHDCQAVLDRLMEMIERTNQLNFTKKRLAAHQLRELLDDGAFECAYLKVQDRYGDYGIAGFYALQAGRLEHFLFSCRILNMGVERWLYNRLGRPNLSIAGEVSDDPTKLPVPDWINASGSTPTRESRRADVNGKYPRVLLKGGCDLEQAIDFIGWKSSLISGEFNYVTPRGAPSHVDHTEILRRCGSDVVERYADVYARLPFLDAKSYQTRFFADEYDVYVYSTLMDMDNGLYRYRESDWVIPYGDFNLNITDESTWDWVLKRCEFFDRDFLVWFRENFTFEGCLSEAAFRDNLHWICGQIPARKQLILLNGAEIPLEHPYEHQRDEHHRRRNAVLEEVIASYAHVELCDVRQFANSPSDVTNNIRHYRRGVYYRISNELQALMARRWSLKPNPVAQLLQRSMAFGRSQVRNMLWATIKRVRALRSDRSSNRNA
jgi:FkbH-like protein